MTNGLTSMLLVELLVWLRSTPISCIFGKLLSIAIINCIRFVNGTGFLSVIVTKLDWTPLINEGAIIPAGFSKLKFVIEIPLVDAYLFKSSVA